VLSEAQDRSILWICKHDPSLEKRLMWPTESAVDPVLLRGAWEGNKVGGVLWTCLTLLGTQAGQGVTANNGLANQLMIIHELTN
jgi:hypothetical protein